MKKNNSQIIHLPFQSYPGMFSADLRIQPPLKTREIINMINHSKKCTAEQMKRNKVVDILVRLLSVHIITNLFEINPLGFGNFCLIPPTSSGYRVSRVHTRLKHLKHPPFLLRQIFLVTQQEVVLH